ncbi:hypothetical protein Pflav_065760 [Phytohabitans flavus]|uniref:Uncharacterized protein n=1 Tax=Phytohabitans flavus TaxID=1076124 RepID=A0A6F8Y233_9ACTN|nr:hypothetical protein Pflav_065760 [Phytohabitans flavus]
MDAERRLRPALAAPRQVELYLPAHAGAADLAGKRTHDRVRGDRARLGSGAQKAHRPRRRVDKHRDVVLIEHHHPDPQRVETLAAQPRDLALLLLGDSRPPVFAGGFSEAPGNRALSPGS